MYILNLLKYIINMKYKKSWSEKASLWNSISKLNWIRFIAVKSDILYPIQVTFKLFQRRLTQGYIVELSKEYFVV